MKHYYTLRPVSIRCVWTERKTNLIVYEYLCSVVILVGLVVRDADELPVATEASVGTDDDSEVGTTAEPSTAEEEPVTVEIPRIDDDDLSAFFITSASVSQHPEQHEKEEASIDTFNDIFIDSNDMCDTLRHCRFFCGSELCV